MTAMRRAAQSLALTTGVLGAACELSDRYDASRQSLYAARRLRERRKRVRAMDSALTDGQEEAGASWLQREAPKFPYVLSLSPADNPATVTQAVLGDSDLVIGSPVESTDVTLDALVTPASGTMDALVRLVAAPWRSLKTQLYGEVPAAFDPHGSGMQRRLDLLLAALREAHRNEEPQDEGDEKEEKPVAPLVFFLRDFDDWDDVEKTQWLHWVHHVTSAGLAHVVLPTRVAITPTAIAEWQRLHTVPDVDFVAILLRVATASSDESSAREKLRALSQRLGLELRDMEDPYEEETPDVVTESSVILETVGNWWDDLERVCELLGVKGLGSIDSHEERLALVMDVCAEVEDAAKTHVLKTLAIHDASERETRISALQAWQCLEVVTQVGDNAQILASPEKLLHKQNDRPLHCAQPVEALMPFNQRTHGEAKFMELIDQRVLFLRPKSGVEIGVVPCDAKTLVAPCWVETRPLVKRVFEKLWRDDANFQRVLELERFEDNHKLSEEIALFQAEIDERRRMLDAQSREFLMMQHVMKESEVAQRRAELSLLELEIESKKVYLERLRALLD